MRKPLWLMLLAVSVIGLSTGHVRAQSEQVVPDTEMKLSGRFWSEKVKAGKASREKKILAEAIKVKAKFRVVKEKDNPGLQMVFTLHNSSDVPVEILNPISMLTYDIVDKSTERAVNPVPPTAEQVADTSDTLTRMLNYPEIKISVIGQSLRKESPTWTLQKHSSVAIQVVLPEAYLQVGDETPKKLPFAEARGLFSVVASVRIALADDPEISSLPLFHGRFKVK